MYKYFALFTMLVLPLTVNAAALFPSIDGGAYDGVQNDLTFNITAGTYTEVGGVGDISDGDTFSITYELTSNSNLAGPQSGFEITLNGTVFGAAPVFFGPTQIGSAGFFSGTAVLTTTFGTELDLTVERGEISDFTAFADSALLVGFAAAPSPPQIPVGAVSFLPVSVTDGGGFNTTFHDFVLDSTVFDINFTTLAISGASAGAVNPIPEPASLLTLLGCVAGVGAMGRRRRKAAAAA